MRILREIDYMETIHLPFGAEVLGVFEKHYPEGGSITVFLVALNSDEKRIIPRKFPVVSNNSEVPASYVYLGSTEKGYYDYSQKINVYCFPQHYFEDTSIVVPADATRIERVLAGVIDTGGD